MFEINWLGLLIPLAYVSILLGSLATFSSLYRKRKVTRAASLAPWFPSHLQRNIYLSLLHYEPESGKGKVPDSVLKSALLLRANEDIRRIVAIRNAKQALSTLLQRGSVGDDLWQRFLRAEQEMDAELREVVEEANAFAPGWGQTIFQSASEMEQNNLLRKRVEEIQAQAKPEKEWWERKKASIQSEFLKELDEESPVATEATPVKQDIPPNRRGSDDDAVLVESGGPASSHGKKKKKGKN